jgi:hypothetical protein
MTACAKSVSENKKILGFNNKTEELHTLIELLLRSRI